LRDEREYKSRRREERGGEEIGFYDTQDLLITKTFERKKN
jgi:hypothetical protein